jgi:hypothetical protein
MLVYTELSKQETRRMQLLGIPMFIVVVACSMPQAGYAAAQLQR